MKTNYFPLILVLAGLMSFGLVSKPDSNSKPNDFVIGVIDELQSKILSEKRVLNIYLPDGYHAGDTTKYDVTYLLDGSADEDFIHVVGLYQFSSFEWIKRTRKTIVVGIETVDRRRDYTFPSTVEEDKIRYPTTGHSDLFMDFIEKELQPYIEGKYNTTSSKTIIGQSLGGLFAAEVLFKRPLMFNRYIIVSPSLWWDNGSLLNQNTPILDSSFSRPTQIYIGVGKEGLAPTTVPHVMEVDANLLAEKIRSGKSRTVTMYFDYLPEEDHATISHQAIYNALKLMSEQSEH